MLKFKDLIIFSTILDKIDIKSHVEYLERRLLKTEKDFKIDNSIKGEITEEQQKELKNKKRNDTTIDLALFVASKAYLVEHELTKILINAREMTEDDVKNLTIDEIVEILKEIFKDGIPSIFKNKFDETLKKTL